MTSQAKILIPDKEWLVKKNTTKLGSILKNKKGYFFIRKGEKLKFNSLQEIESQLGIIDFEERLKTLKKESNNLSFSIYYFPCSNKPYNPVYSIKKKLPLYAKNSKSKSQYCAGYYIIKFAKGWTKAFCPKLITLERYPFKGPFKTENEMKDFLNIMNKIKSLNTLPIEDFLDKARVAIKSNQKQLTLTIKEVADLQNSLSIVMTRLTGEIDQILASAAQPEVIEVKMDGGKF